jgi:hypothetical protein
MENTAHLDESAAFLSILKSRSRKLNLPINAALAPPPIETQASSPGSMGEDARDGGDENKFDLSTSRRKGRRCVATLGQEQIESGAL